MGRSSYQYTVRDLNEAQDIAEKILTRSGFVQKRLPGGELVWKKGSGLLVSQQFVSIYYYEDEKKVLIQGWIQGAFGIPGMGEREVERFGGTIPKRQLAKVIVAIENEFEKIRY